MTHSLRLTPMPWHQGSLWGTRNTRVVTWAYFLNALRNFASSMFISWFCAVLRGCGAVQANLLQANMCSRKCRIAHTALTFAPEFAPGWHAQTDCLEPPCRCTSFVILRDLNGKVGLRLCPQCASCSPLSVGRSSPSLLRPFSIYSSLSP